MERLIDTSTLIEWEKGRLDLPAQLLTRRISKVIVSVVTASEMLHGVHRAVDAKVKARRLHFIEHVLGTFSVVDIDLDTARIHSGLWADLERSGLMISQHDLWIAAACFRHNVPVVTCNVRDFARVPGLTVENWLP